MPTTTIFPPDERTVAELTRHVDGVASVYLAQTVAAEDHSARWHAVSQRLRRAGASENTVVAMGSAVRTVAASGDGLAVFATADAEPVVLRVPGLTGPDRADWSPVARLAPILAWLRDRPPYVLVVTDRTGADIHTAPGFGQPERVSSVLGPDDEIERNAPGGQAQPRYQRRAEDSWRHNAAAVAQACERELRTSGARLLVICGDVRAVQLFEERLPGWIRTETTIRHISGGRSLDGSQSHRGETLAEVARAAAAQWTSDLLARFAEQRAPHGLAVDGELATLEALTEDRAAALLVVRDDTDTRTAWLGDQPTRILPATQDPPGSWSHRTSGPLLDTAIHAALRTGTQVHILDQGTPGAPAEGLGAICRFH
ncbi:MAG: Vms1/Ankzf1 family peptidyl-tRNA hydrolase [Labedaea sp.]